MSGAVPGRRCRPGCRRAGTAARACRLRESPGEGRSVRVEPARRVLPDDGLRAAPSVGSGALMGPGRLELIRIWRTRRWLALMATFVLLGLANPVAAYYLPQLAKMTARGPKVTVATSTAANSISMVVNSLAQLGTLVVVVVAAVTLAVDARPGLAAFYRTRLRHPVLLLLPRYVTTTGVTLVALALGMLAAWYETTALLGAVSFRSLLAALALQAVWFCFVTSVVAFFTSTVRGVPGAIGSSIALLLA